MKLNIYIVALCIISLGAEKAGAQAPPLSAFALNRSVQFLPIGGSDTLAISAVASQYQSYDLKSLKIAYFTANSEIADVDTNGVMTAKRAGETIVFAQSILYNTFVLRCTLAVFEPNLPLAYIDTRHEIVNEPKVDAWMKVYDEAGRLTYDDPIGIEIRGSSTRSFPKKQYGVETRKRGGAGDNNNVKLMGLPSENDWVFNGPYSDKSLLRNVIAFELARKTGWYASRCRFFELYLNGDYRGVYVLLEKIKRDKNRVNIAESDESGDQPFIIKRDKFDGTDNEYFDTQKGGQIQFHYPKPRDITNTQRQFIRNYVTNLETALYGGNFMDETAGYRKYLDVDSWVDYMLIQQITKNNDGFHFSNFMYRDKGGKLVHAPVWDFNLAFGNVNYNNCEKTDGWWYYFWNRQLMKDPYFAKCLYDRWQELREEAFDPENINRFIDSTVTAIKDARIRNYKRWKILGTYIWPNYVYPPSYEEEISYLKNWIEERVDWIDDTIKNFTTVSDEDPQPELPKTFSLGQNYPNPFNPVTTIRYNLPEAAHVKLEIFNVRGQLVATLVNRTRSAGFKVTVWNTKETGNVASGVYFYKLTTPKFTAVKKMLLIK
jgi:hypothetical protein